VKVMGSPITRHSGELPMSGVLRYPWSCHSVEGSDGWGTTRAMTCHHCRIARCAAIVNGTATRTTRIWGEVADVMGVSQGETVDTTAALRVAAQLADDVVVLRMLDEVNA